MAEVLAVAGLGDDVVGEHVGFFAAHAGADELFGGALSGEYDVVDFVEFRIGLADGDRAGEVGAVAVYDDAHIDDDGVSVLNRVVARLGVGHGAVGAGGYDRWERKAFGAEAAGLRLDLERDAAFRPAGLDALGDGEES